MPTALVIVALMTAAGGDSPKPVSFKAEIAPILVTRCLGCHNDKKAANGLNMKTFALLKKGGKAAGGETIVAGDPEASYLVEVTRPDGAPRMPLKQPPLSDHQIALIERWIKEGARFDGGPEATTELVALYDPLRDLPKVALRAAVSDPVASVAFSQDGERLAAAVGKSVLLSDAKGSVATLGEHPGPVSFVAFTRDGKSLVACGGRAGQFGFVTVWDLATKSRRHDLRGHSDAILGADLAPDGTTLATASYDRMVKLWDLAAGRETRTLKEHTDAVHAVAFSRDGLRLASGGADRTVKLWDVATGKRVASLSDSTGEVYAVAFAASGTTLYAAGVDRSIRAWELTAQGGTPVKSVFAHDAPVLRLAVAPDGKSIVSTGEDRRVESWELPGLKPKASLGVQADWPQSVAIHPDGTRVAVGRYDGSLAVLDLTTGKVRTVVREAPKAAPLAAKPKPQLVRNAMLNPPSPRSAERGKTARVVLSGTAIGQAVGIAFDDAGFIATIVKAAKPDPNRLEIDLAIPSAATPGPHRFTAQTPLGVPAPQTFVVSEFPESGETEPNDDPAKPLKAVPLPATFGGLIDRPGDRDLWRFEAKAGDDLVFETIAKGMGSSLSAVLTLMDDSGRVIAVAAPGPTASDPVLSARAERDGPLTLVVTDAQFGGTGNHVYRINAGKLPRVVSTFPMGVAPSGRVAVWLEGANLGPAENDDGLSRPPPRPDASGGTGLVATWNEFPGTILPIRRGKGGRRLVSTRALIVAEGTQTTEREPNDEPTRPTPIAWPGGASGRIDREGDVDFYSFEARKGRREIIEVFGRRLGSPIDPVIEILDPSGRPVARAVLRPVEETNVAFRDHPSTGRNIRLTKWDDLAMGDTLLVGRELMRLAALPRNPDDDAIMWGLGGERSNSGERLAFLETTPEQHPFNQPMFKVEIHPPGTVFPAGGMAAITLNYRNDDGGPGFGKDARVTFDPPADGAYLVRVEDVRGLGGPDFGYHVVVRPPRPDFAVSLSTDDPDVPRGGASIVRVDLVRQDGFEGAVDVTVEGLPSGLTATSARIEPETYTADLLLTAAPEALAFSEPGWRVVARGSSTGQAIRHEIDPGGPLGGRITVTPEADLKVRALADRVVIRPGERVELTLAVERGAAFAGRVPIDVRNLPLGVRVLNIGLNGVLVTESQTSRSIFLQAEPWVAATERPFYAVGRVEASAADSSSPPIPLIVAPAGRATTAARP